MKKVLLTMFLFVCGVSLSYAQAPDVVGESELTTISPVGENTNTVEFRKDGDA